jgi:hypothetical protein
MVRLTGAALGFLAFAITIFLGLVAGNPLESILIGAMRAMLGFFVLGMLAGWVACRVLDEHSLKQHRELFPDGELPPDPPETETDSAGEGSPEMAGL